jgi:hypothetical protein
MKIITWNMEYWQNYDKANWKEECKEYLSNFINSDEPVFILLQETNPFVLFEREYEVAYPYRYSKRTSKGVLIIYYELFNELPPQYRVNPWGNSIIANKTYNNYFCSLDANKDETYCGRNSLMCYTFEISPENKITFINFYNKSHNGIYPMLDNTHFEIKHDINEIVNKNVTIQPISLDINLVIG